MKKITNFICGFALLALSIFNTSILETNNTNEVKFSLGELISSAHADPEACAKSGAYFGWSKYVSITYCLDDEGIKCGKDYDCGSWGGGCQSTYCL